MRVNARRCFYHTVVALLVMTPLFSYAEVLALIFGSLQSQSEVLTPVYIKALKDLLTIFLLSVSCTWIFFSRQRLTHAQVLFTLLLVSFLVLSLIGSLGTTTGLFLFGLRWMLPFFVLVALLNVADHPFLQGIARTLSWVFLLHVAVQFIELFFGSHWYGSFMGQFALRSPGIFLIPSSGALFSICCFIYIYSFGGLNKYLLWLLALISILLTLSMTGMAIFLFLSAYLALRTMFSQLLAFGLTSVAALFGGRLAIAMVPLLGRGEDVISVSGGTRLEIFLEQLSAAGIFSSTFGIGTNVGVLSAKDVDHGGRGVFIADSMFTSLVANLGLAAACAYLVLLIYLLCMSFKRFSDFGVMATITAFACSLSIIWTELFPVNLLLVLGFAYLLQIKAKPHEPILANGGDTEVPQGVIRSGFPSPEGRYPQP